MKLQVTQENLAKALSSVGKVASSRSTLPVLSNVVFRTVGNLLSIEATNLDIAITHMIGSKVTSEGAITVPARLTQDFVSNLPSGVINLELDDNKLHISTDQYNSVINGVSIEEFPVMPAITGGKTLKLSGKLLKKGLSQVLMAASTDEARPTLTGVYFHTQDGKLYMVATDSYRLAEKELVASQEAVSLLIPASALQELMRVLDDGDEEVELTYDDQQVLFQTGDIKLVARLIEGKYPDYRKLIPAKFSTSSELSRADFINITKVSSLFARESAGSVTISVDGVGNKVGIRSVASQLGENTATAAAKTDGDGDITLNSRYLLDALHAMSGDRVVFGFNGKLEPSSLQDPAARDYLHIIMPLKS